MSKSVQARFIAFRRTSRSSRFRSCGAEERHQNRLGLHGFEAQSGTLRLLELKFALMGRISEAARPAEPFRDRGRDEGKLRPSLRTGQANFMHQMWSTTFGALCGLATYVALSS